ncbi:MAG TPA: 50S ribosomal protein L17 [Syntrophales bacterium]|nr:50S ribosomal protein L17 [Syntrophales bacterium]HOD97454.1 50S ribosomal protein L17 [Syntrophales bacterium]HOH72109.1 50S ribosomal protein L17 [Syntrophales bacterium]HPN07718.1 50S ribosomal protein L17 [Syntrophales bacterium]HPX80764.1 50S ribosomal protein L17 [Syntrophales bacterium]
MRHGKADCKLGRTTSHRKAMLRNMVTSFIDHESIQTTDAKAKELKRVAEKMVTLGKRGSLHARRQALGYVRSAKTVKKLFEELSVRYRERAGGYTRIVKLGFRIGDNAPVSLVEFVKDTDKEKSKKKAGAAKKA